MSTTATTTAAATSRKATRDLLADAQSTLAAVTAKLRARFGDTASLVADAAKLAARVRSEWSEYAQLVNQDERSAKSQQGTTDKLVAKPAPTVPVQAVPTVKPVSNAATGSLSDLRSKCDAAGIAFKSTDSTGTLAAKLAAKPAAKPAPVKADDYVDTQAQIEASDEAAIETRIARGKDHPKDAPVTKSAVAAHKPAPKGKAKFGQERRDLVAACKAAGIKAVGKSVDLQAKLDAAKGAKPAPKATPTTVTKLVVAAQKPATKGTTSIDVDAAKADVLRKLSTLSVDVLESLFSIVAK